ncbi:MAG: type I restriction enzyme HsdR N-terminal domain-containing protein [Lachnospiraceae bacterium]
MTDFEKIFKEISPPIVQVSSGKEYYMDLFRERLILKTPEETVRQKILQYLMLGKKVPKEMLQAEMRLSKYQIESALRADIIIEKYQKDNKELVPLAVIECKAPDVMIGDDAICQAVDYADKLNAEYILVTNGSEIVVAKYDFETQRYIALAELPDYQSMLQSDGVCLPEEQPKQRFPFELLSENCGYYCGYEFHPNTPPNLLPFLTNLWECFLDTSHKLPEKQYRLFRVKQDYGIRYLSCGNASGGNYQGAYRSFLVEHQSEIKFMNVSFFDYGTHTILTVSIDKNQKSHNALQYNVEQIIQDEQTFLFPHNGRIAVGKRGSGKAADLKKLIEAEAPELLLHGSIFLGTLHHDKLLYLDDAEMVCFMEKLLSYALIRDQFRKIQS